jgi:Ca2+-transporting ATPase
VAKEASDIIILDDNFSSIVKAVSWGRGIKENIRKFLSFQLTINIVALTLTFISACTSGGRAELPLKPVQLLWVNLIMDSFAALALATEPPTPRLLQQKPQARDAPLITPIMFANMVGHALLQILVLLYLTQVPSSALLFQLKPTDLGNTHHDTIVFTAFVAMQVRIGLRLFFFVRPGERHSGLRNHTHTHTHTHTHFPLVPSPPFFYTVVQLV